VDERKFWVALCEGLGLPAPIRASLAVLPLGARVVTAPPVRRIIAQAFRRHSLDHWLRTLDRAHVPVAPVLPLHEALGDPQLTTRILSHAATPFPFATTALGPSPRLGQHTDELFAALP
jgi:crotonobetainyl-CoA:carnitine CoA-transferase CaiB-like acyl-CoA transferase